MNPPHEPPIDLLGDDDLFMAGTTPAPPPTMDDLISDDLFDFGSAPADQQEQQMSVYELDEIDDDEEDIFTGQRGGAPNALVSNDNGSLQGGQQLQISQHPPVANDQFYSPDPALATGEESTLLGDTQPFLNNDEDAQTKSVSFDDPRNLQSESSQSYLGTGLRIAYSDNGEPYDPPGGIVVYDEKGTAYYDEHGIPYVPDSAPIFDPDGNALFVEPPPPPVGRVLYVETDLPHEPVGELVYYDEDGRPYMDEEDVAYLPLDGQGLFDANGNPLYIEPVPPRVFYMDNGEPYDPSDGMVVYDENGQPFRSDSGEYVVPEDGQLIFDAEGHALDTEFYLNPTGRYYPIDGRTETFVDDFYEDDPYDAFDDLNMADEYGANGYDDEFYEDDPDGGFRSGTHNNGSHKHSSRRRRRGFFSRSRKGGADEMAPIEGENPDERRERRRRIRRQRHEEVVKRAERRRRRRRWCWLCCCICCCLLLLLLLIAAITRFWEDDSDPEPVLIDDDHNTFDDDFELFKPYEGIRTTPMDPYREDDCYFEDQVFPHMTQQCECTGNVTVVPDDVIDMWYQVREDISEEFYEGDYDEPWWSCENSNQALVWLSSGDTRDSGDLYQRYTSAVSFVQLNGTVWDMSNYWLSDNNECLWLGIQCNGRFQMNSLALDTNNIQYVNT